MAIRTADEGEQFKRRPEILAPESVPIQDLRPHPRNYRRHPADQLHHIAESIQRNGVYRNVVVARGNVILAGHGVVEAARKLGLESIPVVRLDIEPDGPQALKLLTGDNEIGHLGEIDDRLLSDILRSIKDEDPAGLVGTGFDEKMLANLVFVTRPEGEVADMAAAAAWAGMPEFEPAPSVPTLSIQFDNEATRDQVMNTLGLKTVHKRVGVVVSCWYPDRPREDLKNVEFK